MNKKAISLIIVLICTSSLATYSISHLYSFKDDLTLERKIIKGEEIEDSKVKITFSLRNNNDRHYGDAITGTFTVDKDTKMETRYHHKDSFTYKQDISIFPHALSSNSTYQENVFEEIKSSNKLSEKDRVYNIIDNHSYQLYDYEKKIIKEMLDSDISLKTFKLSDYLDYIPLNIHFDEDKIINKKYEHEEPWQYGLIDDYFKFSVDEKMEATYKLNYFLQEDDLISLNIERKFSIPKGKKYIHSDNSKFEQYPTYSFFSFFDSDKNRLYLSFDDGSYYKIPSEYKGIFLIPLEKQLLAYGDDFRQYQYLFNDDEIQKIYSPSEKEEIENAFINKSGEICILSKIDKSRILSYLDAKQFKLIKKIKLEAEDEYLVDVLQGENGLLALYSKRRFEWIDNESHEIIMSGRLERDIFQTLKYKDKHRLQLDFIHDGTFLYALGTNNTQITLSKLDESKRISMIRYMFPLKKKADKLKNNNPYEINHYYAIDEAELEIGGENEK